VLLYSCNGSETNSHDHTDDDHAHEQVSGHNHEHAAGDEQTDDHVHEQAEQDHADDQAQEQATEHDEEAHEHEQEIYKISTLKASGFSMVYKTSGQVLSDRKDEILVTTAVPGIISFSGLLYPGTKVSTGQQLFSVSGNNIIESNPEVYYRQAEAEYLAAKENFERAEKLVADKLITNEHYLEKKLAYEKARTAYDNAGNTFTDKGSIIASPAAGYINDLYVTEGQMVRTGDRIASVISGNRLVLKADIPPADLDILAKTRKANFSTGYSPRIFSTDEMNGSIISYGRSTGKNSYYVPVYFRIDHDDELIPGTFADIWLIGEEIHDVIIVPNTALMEEYGKIYVFRETESGEFEKTYLTAGRSNGKVTHVLEGLKEGDRIVTENTYRMKLSLQETALPSHSGHNH
ncbi:MAG: efflux RND transporter periplasmic adaptor subunit, partial [Bacteroidales bacterium]|jgi:RND family efflux transporter MFP subunit|nr:efflux RND transporter periplasmic adaptor subunit [Bacteroidales bacterium]